MDWMRVPNFPRRRRRLCSTVEDGGGAGVEAVSVAVDGQPRAEKLAGRALRVDPGQHEFRFTAAGRPTVTRRFVLEDGDKDRRERIVLEGAAATPAAAPPAPTADVTPSAGGAMGTQKMPLFVQSGEAWSGASIAATA